MILAQPGWLILLLLLPVIATGSALAARSRSAQWGAFVSGRLRAKLLQRSSPIPRLIALICLMLAAALLVITLARPQTQRGIGTEKILGRNILLAIDLSRSMKVADIKPDRLTQAKAVSYELLDALPNDRIGVIGFAGTPFLFAPLTVDHAAVRETINQLDIDWIPTGGSNLAAGLELGIKTLKATGTRQNALILMSDGEEHEGHIGEIAEQAKLSGIEVISIGFGTSQGDFVPDPSFRDGRFRDRSGQEILSRLEPKPLERVARVTGGRFAIATSGADIPAMVEAAVSDLERVEIADRERIVIVDYYQWFLLPAILLLITSIVAATRWRRVGTAAATVLIAFIFCQPLRADAIADAQQAMQQGHFEAAEDAYAALAERYPDSEEAFRFRLAEANAAYRAHAWSAARNAFSQALRSADPEVRQAAHHGLGNTLFEIGWARLSGGPAYPSTREENPEPGDDNDAMNRISEALLGTDQSSSSSDQDELADFTAMAKTRLTEWLTEDTPDEERSKGMERFSDLVTDWIDAVTHYDSASEFAAAKHNRALSIKHLKKLREIFDELNDKSQQLQEGEGPPQESPPQDGDQGDEPNPDADQGEKGEGEDNEQQGEGSNEQDPSEQQDPGDEETEDDGKPKDDGDKESDQPKPGETPEQAARRILNENADTQKGALSPGRIHFRRPEKDW